ncbi:kinase-like protein [Byssothecium circinans]|uniref:Kinase-like protein n=1 Tax=Byssothecium circinans TaxID=147558 RepID=A0A6A5TAY5_9PLEO|nr:kinase-like protein [Byssothecium circinans]
MATDSESADCEALEDPSEDSLAPLPAKPDNRNRAELEPGDNDFLKPHVPNGDFIKVRFPSFTAGIRYRHKFNAMIIVRRWQKGVSAPMHKFFSIPKGIISLKATLCEFVEPASSAGMPELLLELLHKRVAEARWEIGAANLLLSTCYLAHTDVTIRTPKLRKPLDAYLRSTWAAESARPSDETPLFPPKSITSIPDTSFSPMPDLSSPASFVSAYSPASLRVADSPASFMTAPSPASITDANSPASFMTAKSVYNSPFAIADSPLVCEAIVEEPEVPPMPSRLMQIGQEYQTQLQEKSLIQPFEKELNWSGKGQHIIFQPNDEIPLATIESLGASSTAIVDRVLCRRIALARKMMRCTRNWTISDALREVYHLQNLRHAHIVQLVGSYLQGRTFALLMYPAADSHLGTFLENTAELAPWSDSFTVRESRDFLKSSFSCLASAVEYIHEHTIKHMDIKPQNILVKKVRRDPVLHTWRIYLADFGLSRSFASQGFSQTDGPTPRTPKYCAPEQYNYDFRGRSADIFSLGCVYSEILTVLCGRHPHDFADFRRGNSEDESFHANLNRVEEWVMTKLHGIHCWISAPSLTCRILCMLQVDPSKRPIATAMVKFFEEADSMQAIQLRGCCAKGPEPYVAYEPPSA